jgi:hypothetical protein
MKEDVADAIVVVVPLGLQEVLMDAEPDKYFETPHDTGCDDLVARCVTVTDEDLRTRFECARQEKAVAKWKKTFGSQKTVGRAL